YAVLHTPIDAIPDQSENQVIVFTDWMGRSPREIEDQITYPLSLKLQGLAGVKTIRSSSEFNFSMITIIFEDHVNFYFARERVLGKLALAATFLPQGVVPYLASDATALGQIFWYTVEGSNQDPSKLWALQKFYIAPQLNSASGVAEVATVGGMPLEYQIDVNPTALRSYGITLGELETAVSRSNSAVGGRVIQKNNAEYLVRGVGWLGATNDFSSTEADSEARVRRDIEDTVVTERNGTPIYVRNIAAVQVGTQFRRGVLEKDGNDVVGGVVLMRFGENPLAVTKEIKKKIEELQPGLPPGVRIVPAYDRTGLIYGAIDTLKRAMTEELIIAALAVFLILWHVRSAFVICVTLPLSVLFSFLLMWVLRQFGIIDIQANIMSLAGITISIGVLVDQAIVMTENATHHLKEQFGDQKVTGDIRELIIPACKMVGRPIFFSVMIMLISFLPVFALTGREGKLFHPLAFTKSFALVGVSILSVTVVPALIPTFLKGRLRSEEENWIVRSFIHIYKPVLAWALPRRNLVMWAFAVLLIVAAGLFPLHALIMFLTWKEAYLLVLVVTTTVTVSLIRGWHWQILAFVSLVLLGFGAYYLPKIGVTFMPPLDEGSILDMPVTVPRTSVTESADDLKFRDSLLRQFPEVESVIGKAGRADTPTDPAPLEMVETFINLRPKEQWPRRVMTYDDALWQVRQVLARLEDQGYVMHAPHEFDRDNLVNEVAMNAQEKFDRAMREMSLQGFHEFEESLRETLTRFAVVNTLGRLQKAGRVTWIAETVEIDRLTQELTLQFGSILATNPTSVDAIQLTQQIVRRLQHDQILKTDPAQALLLKERGLPRFVDKIMESLGAEAKTFAGEVLRAVNQERARLWQDQIHPINWALFDFGVERFTRDSIQEIAKSAADRGLRKGAARGEELANFAGGGHSEDLAALQQELQKPFASRLNLWRRQGGPKGDLVKELHSVMQVPGWTNIWTQPIANRIDMLSTGVRTPIGVKVFGPDLETIDRTCRDIEATLKTVPGAKYVVAEPIMGKGYLEITIDRQRAARYGIQVGDIQDTIEVALGGRMITQTVEGRDRFPVRIRYARDFREDDESVRHLLVSPGMNRESSMSPSSDEKRLGSLFMAPGTEGLHETAPEHAAGTRPRLQIPLGEVADVRIVEGPAVIKSENGQLRNYVTLTADRDLVGFVKEAQKVVEERVTLPEGVHIEWAGEFENQVRAARTNLFVFPATILIIFVILYMTYKDVADAGLMMLAVPEALAGGAFLMAAWHWLAPPMEFSVAVQVGFIACFGMATETGIIMLVYLRDAIDKRGGLAGIQSLDELRLAVIEGAVHRLRPKLLTEGVAIIALAPMLWATGVGAEIIKPMAIPVLGGLLIADEVVDIFLPVRFYWVRRARWLKLHPGASTDEDGAGQE
ncbi:MAG TPA: efflux RND transporter permease subunit, partial [Gemmataceae bacterium]|nr:efflux RND transporter permease subunit [Gemmataceae bacterium]